MQPEKSNNLRNFDQIAKSIVQSAPFSNIETSSRQPQQNSILCHEIASAIKSAHSTYISDPENVIVENKTGSPKKKKISSLATVLGVLEQSLERLEQDKISEIHEILLNNFMWFENVIMKFLPDSHGLVQYLKRALAEYSDNYNRSTQSLLDKRRQMLEARIISKNVDQAIKVCYWCVRILEMAKALNYRIDQKQYFGALKLTDDLEILANAPSRAQVDAKDDGPLNQQFEFVMYMSECIPHIRRNIKAAVLENINQWFVDIRDQSTQLGAIAMQNTLRRNNVHINSVLGASVASLIRRDLSSSSLNLVDSASVLLDSQESIEETFDPYESDDEFDPLNNEQITVDFTPFYECDHIHSVLKCRDQFQQQYEQDRRLQLDLILSTNVDLSENSSQSTGNFEIFLQKIIGFFLIEKRIVSTTENFYSKLRVESLWENAVDILKNVVSSSLETCNNPDYILKVKALLMVFIQTMELEGFKVDGIVDLLVNTFFSRYVELELNSIGKKCCDAIDYDDGNPIIAETIEQYDEIIVTTKFLSYEKSKARMAESLSFPEDLPRNFQFSESFLICCREIRKFIDDFYQFTQGLYEQFPREMDTILENGVHKLLVKNISGGFVEKIKSSNINFSELIRIIINLDIFPQVLDTVDRYIHQKQLEYSRQETESTTSSSLKSKKSQAVSTFNKIQQMSEERIFDEVHRKVTSFLELRDYDFFSETALIPGKSRPQSPTKKNITQKDGEPSQYLVDLTTYLDSLCSVTFVELSSSIRSFIQYDAINLISTSWMDMLLSSEVKKISYYFVDEQFKVDVLFLQNYLEGLQDDKLLDPLQDLIELVKLLQTSNPLEGYLDKKIRQKEYSRINPHDLLKILEKYRNGNPHLSQTDPSRQKALDAIINSLK